jgi:hypothetical protein
MSLRKIKLKEIENYSLETKYSVGDKILFLTGKTDKEKISLTNLISDEAIDAINFNTGENFVVEYQPYLYYCEVLKINESGKPVLVKLIRRAEERSKNRIFAITDYEDEKINIYSPQPFNWHDGKAYETYVIRSNNMPFTPLMGIACRWEWDDDYFDEKELRGVF